MSEFEQSKYATEGRRLALPHKEIPWMQLCSDDDKGCPQEIFFFEDESAKACPRCGSVVQRDSPLDPEVTHALEVLPKAPFTLHDR